MIFRTAPADSIPSWQILVACCQEDQTDFNRLCGAVGSDRHWQSLYASALREGIGQLLYWRLHISGLIEQTPQPLAEVMRRKYYATGAAAAFCAAQLHDLLPRCHEAGLPVIILKGAVLAELYYPNPALRAMSDIDILVRPQDLDLLEMIFTQAGYSTKTPRSLRQQNKPEAYLTTRIYRRQDGGGLPFHVHTHLLNSTIPNIFFLENLPIKTIWKAARKIRIANTEALTLDPRHQIIHLAEHSLRVTHSLTRLQYLYDIDRVIHACGEEVDWRILGAEAKNWQLGSFLYYPLALANRWLKTRVPPFALTLLQPKPGLMERLFGILLARNFRRTGLSYLLHLSCQPSFKKQLAFVFQTAFPPRQVLALRCGIPLDEVDAIVYVRRVVEIAAALLSTIQGGLVRSKETS